MLVTGVAGLYSWCRRVTGGYPGVEVTNMTEDWRNGLAFCAVIHRFRPDLIDFYSLRPEDVYSNCALAFSVAETELGIPALLDSRDMKEMTKLDKFSIITYLAQFYHKFSESTPQPTVRNSLVNNGVRNNPLDVDQSQDKSDSDNVNYPVEVNSLSDADNTSSDSGLDRSIDQLVDFPPNVSTASSPCLISLITPADSNSSSVSSNTESKSTFHEKVNKMQIVSATLNKSTTSRFKLAKSQHSKSFESLVNIVPLQRSVYEDKNYNENMKTKHSKTLHETIIPESTFKAALKKFNSLSTNPTKEFENTTLKTIETPKTLAKPCFTSVHVQTENTTVSQITQTDEFLIDKQIVPNCHKNNKTLAHDLLSNYVRYYSNMLGMKIPTHTSKLGMANTTPSNILGMKNPTPSNTLGMMTQTPSNMLGMKTPTPSNVIRITNPTPPCSSQYRNSDQSEVPSPYCRYSKPITTYRNIAYDKQISDLVSHYQDPQPLPRPPNSHNYTPSVSPHPQTIYSKNKQFKCVPQFSRTHSTLV